MQLVVVLLALCSFCFAEYTIDEGVIVLEQEIFDDVVKDNKYVLVEFCELASSIYCTVAIFFASLQMLRGVDIANH